MISPLGIVNVPFLSSHVQIPMSLSEQRVYHIAVLHFTKRFLKLTNITVIEFNLLTCSETLFHPFLSKFIYILHSAIFKITYDSNMQSISRE